MDLGLLFKEVIRVKRVSGCNASVREILFASIAEYNRMCTTKAGQSMKVTPGNTLDCFNMFQPCEAWRITEGTKRFLYNLLRCGDTFLEILKTATDDVPWSWSGQGQTVAYSLQFKHEATF